MNSERALSVSELVNACSDMLQMNFERVMVEGEVSSYKVNQGKYVFFDLKDEMAVLPCFMMLFAVRLPIADGMKVRIVGVPKIATKWGKFSFTVERVMPVGEGAIKKSFEMLRAKLSAEGLFSPTRKRLLPDMIQKIGVISSMQAAGYADFVKILNERWGGLEVQLAHTQVQGAEAVEQIIGALERFNERSEVDVIAVIRGGGSAEDLASFNDEKLVRAIASSKLPVITGIGHEVDETLADLVADVRASTPSNVAQVLTRDKNTEKIRIVEALEGICRVIIRASDEQDREVGQLRGQIREALLGRIELAKLEVGKTLELVAQLNPERVLERGYALVRGDLVVGSVVNITTDRKEMIAKIKSVKERK